ncbi:MAG: LysM peptidoglycan-binding domain-containing protein [Alphaproteobacteria bacterium]|nr:LysM peptidoglycan-binding domain-containing protein [Alphaproteobacteria bacterium]
MKLIRAVRLSPLVVLLAFSSAARAADMGPEGETATEQAPEKRGGLFPPFRKRSRPDAGVLVVEAPAEEAEVEVEPTGDGPSPDAPATDEQPEGGVWEWVDRLEGEIPSPETLEAARELAEEQGEERALVDDLSGAAPPLALYGDPAGAMKVDPLYLDMVDPSEFDIPIEVNPWVEKWVRYFTGDGRKYYARWLSRSTRYQPMMRRELAERGLPQDLVYLSMIESGYNAHAYSTADAAGLWQFITSTGKLYKLRIDYWVDERRDPEEALDAAATFLSELHNMFGDWRLAWASYNGGPGRVRRATEKAGTKDFWTLADGTYLHPETDNYVPKIMAAAIIGHHPERYGFTGIEFQDELVYETAHVDGSLGFETLARCAGVSVDDLKELNPALRRYATPPEGYDLRLPVGTKDRFVVALADVPKEERVAAVSRHTVRRGETLSTIASKYHTSVSALSRANNLKNVNRIYVGMSLVIPRGGEAPSATASRTASTSSSATSSSASSSRSSSAPSKPSTHTVARGDTLSGIATRYGVTVSQLRSWNSLSGSTIMVGQKLKVSSSGGSSSGSSSTSTASTASSSSRTHTVRSGETLSSIASRYGVSTSDLQRWNGISNAGHIEVGQSLKVSGSGGSSTSSSSASSWTTYTVRSGDSLGAIATRYGCTVSQLKSWNGLSGSVIQPGQKLKVRRA